MKIAFPPAGIIGDQKFSLSKDFVESGLLGVFDPETGSVDIISKSEMGKGLMDTLKDLSVSTIITPELKVMALKVFKEQGVEVYKAQGKTLSMNIELLKQHQLLPYSVIEMFTQGAGGCSTSSSCSSCSSTSCN